MKRCFINGVGCVSTQATTEENFLDNPVDYANEHRTNVIRPDYRAFIPPAAIRRMGSSVRNSVVASSLALQEAGEKDIDAIITGTGLGCIGDSEKFLNKLLDDDEQYLTPTSFIQSTHNTVAGQIALGLNCKSYNVTYVNAGVSFPSALLDGLMKIQTGKNRVLVGGMDELSTYTNRLYELISHYKKEGKAPGNILKERTEGCVASEGAAFFVLENEKKSNSYGELLDVFYLNKLEESELESFVESFLKRNGLSIEDLDLMVLGNNGDKHFDHYYDEVEKFTPSNPKVFYKHLFGEFMSSPAVGLWTAAKILKEQNVPEVLFRDVPETPVQNPKYILLYNQYRGKDHSLTLVRNV